MLYSLAQTYLQLEVFNGYILTHIFDDLNEKLNWITRGTLKKMLFVYVSPGDTAGVIHTEKSAE